MSGEPDISVPARALGDPARARIAGALVGDREIPAGELARAAGVSASTASEHLAILAAAGIVTVAPRGRRRYYRLADADVARAVEALQAIAPRVEIRSLAQSSVSNQLRAARTCYDHLAGDLGLRIADLLVRSGVVPALEAGVPVQPPDPFPRGEVVRALGLRPRSGARAWLRGCLDWSGRRPHAAGQAGADILATFIAHGWVTRRRTSRAVLLTADGDARLRELEERFSAT